MRENPDVYALGRADEAVNGSAYQAVPPMVTAAVSHEDLSDPVRAREVHQFFYGIIAI